MSARRQLLHGSNFGQALPSCGARGLLVSLDVLLALSFCRWSSLQVWVLGEELDPCVLSQGHYFMTCIEKRLTHQCGHECSRLLRCAFGCNAWSAFHCRSCLCIPTACQGYVTVCRSHRKSASFMGCVLCQGCLFRLESGWRLRGRVRRAHRQDCGKMSNGVAWLKNDLLDFMYNFCSLYLCLESDLLPDAGDSLVWKIASRNLSTLKLATAGDGINWTRLARPQYYKRFRGKGC